MTRRRVLLKLSGESMCSPGGSGIDSGRAAELAGRLRDGFDPERIELALILGGGNILRGARISGDVIDRITADQMGMLATVMNAMALRAALDSAGVPAEVLSAVPVGEIAETFTPRRAASLLGGGRIVILAGGTGHPYFTTDTTASLRALEIGADVLYKATKVDGVYSDDPVENPDAELFSRLSYAEVLERRLRVMDATAITMCMDNGLPIRVFNMQEPGNIERVLRGEEIGTVVE